MRQASDAKKMSNERADYLINAHRDTVVKEIAYAIDKRVDEGNKSACWSIPEKLLFKPGEGVLPEVMGIIREAGYHVDLNLAGRYLLISWENA